jgi:hypothetical protein
MPELRLEAGQPRAPGAKKRFAVSLQSVVPMEPLLQLLQGGDGRRRAAGLVAEARLGNGKGPERGRSGKGSLRTFDTKPERRERVASI